MSPSSVIVSYLGMVFIVKSAITCLKNMSVGLSELDQRQNELHITGTILSRGEEVLI